MDGHAGADRERAGATWRLLAKTLITPADTLECPGDRRRAELLAGLLLLLISLGLLSGLVQLAAVPNFLSRFLVLAIALALLSGAYGISRTRGYRLAALAACLIPVGACLAILKHDPNDQVALPFMTVAVLVATVFLPMYAACLTAGGVLAVVLAMPLLVPALASPERWIPSVGFHVIVSALLLLAAQVRNRIESEQAVQLRRLETAKAAAESEVRRLDAELVVAQNFATAGRLATGVGHDLNNLLTMMVDLRSAVETADHRLAGQLSRANGAGEVATRLVSKMLAMARTPERPSKPSLVDLNDVLKDSVELLGCAAGRRCELIVRCHTTPLRSRIDPLDLQRVLLNLAGNAGQAMPLGGTLTIETNLVESVPTSQAPDLGPGPYGAIVVQDSGVGMDTAALARAFQPFVSGRAAEGGVGMGLAIVADLVGRLGGIVDVWSEPGRGTRFTVVLPLSAESSPGNLGQPGV
jgi:signal transduction histidine kinase